MKKRLTKLLTGLMLAPLLMTSCQTVDKSIDVAYNLDYLFTETNVEGKVEDYFPTLLTTDDVLMMLETKQDFVLYLFQEYCASCNELASPKVKKFLSNRETPLKIYAYDANAIDRYVLTKHEKYGPLFDVTPKIMFFKEGEHFMTLSDKRYTDYKLFSSAMSSFCARTSLYTASKPQAIDSFLKEKKEYVIYFLSSITVNEQTTKRPSYTFYKENIFHKMKNKTIPTLIIEDYRLPKEYKNELYVDLGLDSSISTWSIVNDGTQSIAYNYYDDNSAANLITSLNNLN